MLVAVTMRIIDSPLRNLFANLFLIGLVLYLISRVISSGFSRKRLKRLRKFTERGSKITDWLDEHKEELRQDQVRTLNHPEFVEIIRRDQELYEIIIKDYPDYPDTVMPPKELHRHLLEIAQGMHKRT